jgi:hypothetical protein
MTDQILQVPPQSKITRAAKAMRQACAHLGWVKVPGQVSAAHGLLWGRVRLGCYAAARFFSTSLTACQ